MRPPVLSPRIEVREVGGRCSSTRSWRNQLDSFKRCLRKSAVFRFAGGDGDGSWALGGS
jgi:hypothetical protein